MTTYRRVLIFWLALTLEYVECFKSPQNQGHPHAEAKGGIDQNLVDGYPGIKGMTKDGKILTGLDMRLTPRQYLSLYGQDERSKVKRAWIHDDPSTYWPKALIPYAIDTVYFTDRDRYLILSGFTEIERFTCIRFRPRTSADWNYVEYIRGSGGCSSVVGFLDQGMQDIYLGDGCKYRTTYIHETLHTLGIVHEHQLYNRDKFVQIKWDNLEDGFRDDFDKYTKKSVNRMGVPYSLRSIMHYGSKAFSKDGIVETIVAKDPSNQKYIDAQHLGLAYSDVHLINLLYGCASHCPDSDKSKCGANGHLDKNCNCICEDGSQDCDSTKTKVSNDTTCTNAHFDDWECYRLTAQGKCYQSVSWMAANCARACGMCGVDPVVNNNNIYNNTGTGPCENAGKSDYECRKLTLKGRCKTSKARMSANCAKSCGTCVGNAGDDACRSDVYTRCQVWKDRGECVVSPDWMGDNCQFTCDTCKGKRAKRPAIDCADKFNADKCHLWAVEGECVINTNWMAGNCARACHTCDV